jgi:hypothetical protein
MLILPGLPFPPGSFQDAGLVRNLAELLAWSSRASKIVEGGEPVLVDCYQDLLGLLSDSGAGNAQADYGVRYRLPTSLRGLELQRWDSRGLTGLKHGVGLWTHLEYAPSLILLLMNCTGT